MANIGNCFIRSNVDFRTASGWLDALLGASVASDFRENMMFKLLDVCGRIVAEPFVPRDTVMLNGAEGWSELTGGKQRPKPAAHDKLAARRHRDGGNTLPCKELRRAENTLKMKTVRSDGEMPNHEE